MFSNFFKPKQSPGVAEKEISKEEQFELVLTKLFNWKNFSDKQQEIPTNLMALADLILWMEKNRPEKIKDILAYNLFDKLYNELYPQCKMGIMQSLSLIITNAKNEDLIQQIFGSNLLSMILKQQSYDEELITYFVSLLKSLSQRINKKNITLLLKDNKSIFIQRCAEFYNDQESMIRTSTLNIILSLMKLNLPELNEYFRSFPFNVFYINISIYMNKMFQSINEQLMNLNEKNVKNFYKLIEDLEDMILFFEDISKIQDNQILMIVGQVLYHYVMLPMILASMRVKQKGFISINLAVYILIRMLKTIQNFGIQDLVLGNLFCLDDQGTDCWREEDQYMNKQSLQRKNSQFQMRLSKIPIPNEKTIKIVDIRSNIFTLLKSKDDNLVYLITTLLITIIRSKSYSKQILIKCGLNLRSDDTNTRKTRQILLPILFNQLSTYFRIITLKNIALLIIEFSVVGNQFNLNQSCKLMFHNTFQDNINCLKEFMKLSLKYDVIAEFFQNDFKYITQKILDHNQNVSKQAFSIPGIVQSDMELNFFERNPADPDETMRYTFFVFNLLRKLRYMIFKESIIPEQEKNLEKEYNSKFISHAHLYKPGEFYEIPTKTFYPCNIVGDKVLIPCYIVDDDYNFVISMEDHNKMKIILNIKYKHINPIIDHRKINFITIKIKGYNQVTQTWKSKDDLTLKCSDIYIGQKVASFLISRKNSCRQSELSFINKLIIKSEKDNVKLDLIELL